MRSRRLPYCINLPTDRTYVQGIRVYTIGPVLMILASIHKAGMSVGSRPNHERHFSMALMLPYLR